MTCTGGAIGVPPAFNNWWLAARAAAILAAEGTAECCGEVGEET